MRNKTTTITIKGDDKKNLLYKLIMFLEGTGYTITTIGYAKHYVTVIKEKENKE